MICLLVLSTVNLNQDEFEIIDETIEVDPFGCDAIGRASNSASNPLLPAPTAPNSETGITEIAPEPPTLVTPRTTLRPTITPTDEPIKPPYIFPVPINIPDYYFDPRAPTAKPRVTATPTRQK